MIPLLLIPLFALLNRAAGWDAVEDYQKKHGLDTYDQAWTECPAWMRWAVRLTSDGLVAAYVGLLVGFLSKGNTDFLYLATEHVKQMSFNFTCFLVVFAGWWIWRAPGWGPMFHALNGRPYVGTGRLSKFVERFLGDYSEAAGAVYGCLRGFLGMLPFAAGLAVLGHAGASAALLAAGACMGAVYWIGGKLTPGSVVGGEIIMGALIGAAMGVL